MEFLPGSDSVLLAACARGVLSVDRRSGAASELFSARLRPGSRARLTHLATSGHSALACLSFSDGALLWVDPARPGAAATTTAYPHAAHTEIVRGVCGRQAGKTPCEHAAGGADVQAFIVEYKPRYVQRCMYDQQVVPRAQPPPPR